MVLLLLNFIQIEVIPLRKDGTRVKDANPIYTVMPYILKYRYDAIT
jgi:hypothetical protein